MVALCLAVTQRQWTPSIQCSCSNRLRRVRSLQPRTAAAARVLNQSRLAIGTEIFTEDMEPAPALLRWVVGIGVEVGLAERKTHHAQKQDGWSCAGFRLGLGQEH